MLVSAASQAQKAADFIQGKAAHQTTEVQAAWAALTMVSYVLPLAMVEVREYLDTDGRSPFAAWSDRLNREAAAKVAAALARVQQGNFSNAKGVGGGVYEYRIEFGPGYRIYFGKDGDRLVILVGGGTKKRQQEDINTALVRWQDYKQRKEAGR